MFKCFNNYIQFSIIPIILNEEDIDLVIDEIVNDENFEITAGEMESYDKKKELIFPQEQDSNQPIVFVLEDLKEKEIITPGVESVFKRSRHINIFILIISQNYYDLPKKSIVCSSNIYHIFIPNDFRDVQNLYLDKTSMDMTLTDFKYLTITCWNEKY